MEKEVNQSIMLVNRITGELQQETVFGDGALRFMYETLLGKTFWGIAFHSAKLSNWLGKLYDSPKSKKKIPALASIPGCTRPMSSSSMVMSRVMVVAGVTVRTVDSVRS